MIRTVLFDLDGTIVDTNELIISSFLHALEGIPGNGVGRDFIIPNMGKPLMEQLMMFSGLSDVEELTRVYREYNLRMHDELVREFPHVREVIAELRNRGIQVGIVTSKIRLTTEKSLKFCGLDAFMQAVVTIDDVLKPKPDPEGIQLAMRELSADPETTMMVGDSPADIEAAQNAGVRSVGVAWSLKGAAFLRTLNPDHIIEDMRELLDIVGHNEG
jgi:pyrophosphatase PpaX